MANCGLVLNEGSFIGLNDGGAILLNDDSCAVQPGGGVDTSGPAGGSIVAGWWSKNQWHNLRDELEEEKRLRALRKKRRADKAAAAELEAELFERAQMWAAVEESLAARLAKPPASSFFPASVILARLQEAQALIAAQRGAIEEEEDEEALMAFYASRGMDE